jgi:hypothetical protein
MAAPTSPALRSLSSAQVTPAPARWSLTHGRATDAAAASAAAAAQTCAALYVVGSIAGLIPMLTLLYVAFVLLFTAPKGYQLKKAEVDKASPAPPAYTPPPHVPHAL